METNARDVFNEILAALYDETFFATLGYSLPKNNALEFSLKRPVFIFDRSLELQLLTIADLASVDPDEALLFLNQLNEPLLPKKSKALLISNLNTLKIKH